MIVTYDTVYRGFLAHIRSLSLSLAACYFERLKHPDGGVVPLTESAKELQEMWDIIRTDTVKVLHVELPPWNELPLSSELIRSYVPPLGSSNQGDPLRVRMGVLKKMADKAREKDPSIRLLKKAVL